MDICIVLFVLLLVPCSTMSQYYIFHLSREEPIVNITSPNYPNYYDDNDDIIWEVIAPTGFRVMVQFTYFELEERSGSTYYDLLTVYHRLTNSFEDATKRALLAGFSLPGNISSIGSYLWIQFTTDHFITKRGFSLSVRAVESVFNLTSEGTIVTITSPNFPNNYGNNEDILWQVIAPTGFRVMVQFTDFNLEWSYDTLSVYHGLTNSFDDATQRASLSGSSLPDNISSIGSYLWLWFKTDSTWKKSGFSLMVSAVKPDWACDFKEDTCGIKINEGSWTIGEQANYYYIKAEESASSFTIPHAFTSKEGSLSFGLYKPSNNVGHLSVTVCKSKNLPSYTIPSRRVVYEYIQYSCSGIQDIEVKFTKLGSQRTSIRVFDIQLYEISGPTTASPSTVGTQTTPLPGTLPGTQPTDKSTQGSRGSKSSLIPALSSTIVLILIIIVIITVFVFMRRRFRDPKVTEPVDQEDDDPNLYNNPVYCSKDDGLPVQDLIISTNSHTGSVSQARHPSTNMDNQYEECEGDRHPVTNADGSLSHHDALSDTHSLPKKDLQNGGKQGQLDGPAVLDDYEEYNALTFNQSSDITRALKKPTSGGENVNNGYGVLDLPEQKDSKLSVNSLQLHNDDVYNSLNEGPQEQQNGKQQATDQSSGYQALKLGQSNIPISHQGLNHKMGSTDDGSTGGYQSLSPGTKGPGPKAGSYERDQPGDESEYHGYQDPREMNQDGSARTPTELDVFSSDNYNILNSGKEVGDYHGYQDPSEMNQDGSARTPTELDDFSSDKYNILNSGKEVGDYHVYQATDDTGVDEGNYEDLDAKMSREDEYSEIDQSQNHAPGTTDNATFEPIYSDEVYSEFQ